MSAGIEELARRLVVGRKRDGRSVYDETAKAELVAACGRPGVLVSRQGRECGINANQLSRWVREHGQHHQRAIAVSIASREAFAAVPVEAVAPKPTNGNPSSVRPAGTPAQRRGGRSARVRPAPGRRCHRSSAFVPLKSRVSFLPSTLRAPQLQNNFDGDSMPVCRVHGRR
jgi:transposase